MKYIVKYDVTHPSGSAFTLSQKAMMNSQSSYLFFGLVALSVRNHINIITYCRISYFNYFEVLTSDIEFYNSILLPSLTKTLNISYILYETNHSPRRACKESSIFCHVIYLWQPATPFSTWYCWCMLYMSSKGRSTRGKIKRPIQKSKSE